MRVQRNPRVRRGGEDGGQRQGAEDEDPTDRVVRMPGHDRRPNDGRSRDRGEEEGVQPKRARLGNVLFGGDSIENQPPCDQGDSRER